MLPGRQKGLEVVTMGEIRHFAKMQECYKVLGGFLETRKDAADGSYRTCGTESAAINDCVVIILRDLRPFYVFQEIGGVDF